MEYSITILDRALALWEDLVLLARAAHALAKRRPSGYISPLVGMLNDAPLPKAFDANQDLRAHLRTFNARRIDVDAYSANPDLYAYVFDLWRLPRALSVWVHSGRHFIRTSHAPPPADEADARTARNWPQLHWPVDDLLVLPQHEQDDEPTPAFLACRGIVVHRFDIAKHEILLDPGDVEEPRLERVIDLFLFGRDIELYTPLTAEHVARLHDVLAGRDISSPNESVSGAYEDRELIVRSAVQWHQVLEHNDVDPKMKSAFASVDASMSVPLICRSPYPLPEWLALIEQLFATIEGAPETGSWNTLQGLPSDDRPTILLEAKQFVPA